MFQKSPVSEIHQLIDFCDKTHPIQHTSFFIMINYGMLVYKLIHGKTNVDRQMDG